MFEIVSRLTILIFDEKAAGEYECRPEVFDVESCVATVNLLVDSSPSKRCHCGLGFQRLPLHTNSNTGCVIMICPPNMLPDELARNGLHHLVQNSTLRRKVYVSS